MDEQMIKNVVEAALMAAGRPLSMEQLLSVFGNGPRPDKKKIRQALDTLTEDYAERGMELVQVASGFRIQVQTKYTDFISRLWDEKPPRYSRALMETLALIAYRQPITRGEIEEVRGVTVSTNIVRSLLERNWVRVVGHRDVPGKPEMFGTTKDFLDYFSLKRLDDLPTLAEIKDIDPVNEELALSDPNQQAEASGEDHADNPDATPFDDHESDDAEDHAILASEDGLSEEESAFADDAEVEEAIVLGIPAAANDVVADADDLVSESADPSAGTSVDDADTSPVDTDDAAEGPAMDAAKRDVLEGA